MLRHIWSHCRCTVVAFTPAGVGLQNHVVLVPVWRAASTVSPTRTPAAPHGPRSKEGSQNESNDKRLHEETTAIAFVLGVQAVLGLGPGGTQRQDDATAAARSGRIVTANLARGFDIDGPQ